MTRPRRSAWRISDWSCVTGGWSQYDAHPPHARRSCRGGLVDPGGWRVVGDSGIAAASPDRRGLGAAGRAAPAGWLCAARRILAWVARRHIAHRIAYDGG